MKYSIILPCYNVTAYLSACMDSLFANDLSDSEIILVNDGSKDDFLGWCKYYFRCEIEEDVPRMTVSWKGSTVKIINQTNMGVSAARNAGIGYADGEYLLFIDPDDTVTPDYIATISEELSGDDCDFLLFGFRQIAENDDGFSDPVDVLPKKEYRISSTDQAISDLLPNFFGRSLGSIDHWLKTGVFNPYQEDGMVCRCAYRHSIIRANGIRFREKIRLREDEIFICEFVSHISTAKTCMTLVSLHDSKQWRCA